MSRRGAARSVVTLVVLGLAAGCTARVGPMERGLALYDKGYYDAAIAAFDEAVRESPRSAAAYTNRGVARIRTGDTPGAVADFTRAHELNPDDAEVLVNRGNAYVGAGDMDAAIADFTRAVELRPEFAHALFNRGIARARAGDHAGARADWLRAAAVERDPQARASMEHALALLSGQAAPAIPSPRPPTPSAAQPAPQSALAQPAPLSPPAQPAPLAQPPTPPAASPPPKLDARTLAKRGLDRELDGDRAGALDDLRAALAIETDPGHRVGLHNLIRLLEAPR